MDKAVVTVGYMAVLLSLPPDTSFVAAMLAAIAVSALCEGVGERGKCVLVCAYSAVAVVLPICAVSLALVAYDAARDRRTWLRFVWVIPLACAFPRLPLSAFCVIAVMCAVACVLASRNTSLANERRQYRILRDSVREQALALERRNRDLKRDLADMRKGAAGVTGAFSAEIDPPSASGAYPSLVFASLTERELEIAAHVARGLDNREIATAVCASEGTVRNHISSILQKTGLHNRTQIAIAYLTQA